MVEIPDIVIRTRNLLTLRGFQVNDLFEFENRYEMYPTKTTKEGMVVKTICRIFKESKVVGISVIRDIHMKMEEEEAQMGMIVGGTRFTPAAKKFARKIRVELVEGGYSSYDLFGHQLVPRHIVAATEEVDLVLKHYGIELRKLPRILRDDPAVRILGAKAGQVIRIQRDSPTAGTIYYYRLVVDSKR